MEGRLQPQFFGPEGHRLLGVYHPVPGKARAALLLCPPLLHEYTRSYRFFHQIAEQLVAAGVAVLRFDYLGAGDSEGDDAAFTPRIACENIREAATELRRRSPDVPLVLMGVRGSALFASRMAAEVDASLLCLWQPVSDGQQYLQTLQARYRDERQSRFRYPLLSGQAPAGAHDLMGFALSAVFAEQLAAYSLDGIPSSMPIVVLDGNDARAGYKQVARFIELPRELTAWADEIDLNGLISPRLAMPALERLIAVLPEGERHG